MRSRMTRHLASMLEPEAAPVAMAVAAAPEGAPAMQAIQTRAAYGVLAARAPEEEPIPLPAEFSWHDYAVFLLHVAAEIEHALMVQYLYGAYSLGGPQVPERYREAVRDWQIVILGIAKEEMGHLVTVENLLRLIGGPLNFEREDYPYRSDFYPFTFTLERLSLDSLAKYVYAEMPEEWEDPDKKEIIERAERANQGQPLNRVGKLYTLLIRLFESKDPYYLRERDILRDSVVFQASWDEWGRGYRGGERGGSSGPESRTPDLLIEAAGTRDKAVAGLKAVAEQGEASTTQNPEEESHFTRFLRIYKDVKAATEDEKAWRPSRPVPKNPRIGGEPGPEDDPRTLAENQQVEPDLCVDEIRDPEAIAWAHLSNLRYRMLLVNLMHALDVEGPLSQTGALTPRGSLVNRTFGEMYNLRSIAGILVQLPRLQGGNPRRSAAGPPFNMPYTLSLPEREPNRWRLHRDLIEASRIGIATLREIGTGHIDYLQALEDSDRLALEQIERLIPPL